MGLFCESFAICKFAGIGYNNLGSVTTIIFFAILIIILLRWAPAH